jgi:hypothetical protein
MDTPVKMTPEEKPLKKKENKRAYQREYMANRRKNDPEFAEKQRAAVRKNLQARYDNDEEYRKNKAEKYKEIYNKYKDAYILVQKLNISVD